MSAAVRNSVVVNLLVCMGLCACVSCAHEGLTVRDGVIDVSPRSGLSWSRGCRIHRPCEEIAPILPCSPDVEAATFPLPPIPPAEKEVTLKVAGRLFTGKGILSTDEGCMDEAGEMACCHATFTPVLLHAENGAVFELPSLGCKGDDSRLCCEVIADGRKVVVTGTAQARDLSFLSIDTLCSL